MSGSQFIVFQKSTWHLGGPGGNMLWTFDMITTTWSKVPLVMQHDEQLIALGVWRDEVRARLAWERKGSTMTSLGVTHFF